MEKCFAASRGRFASGPRIFLLVLSMGVAANLQSQTTPQPPAAGAQLGSVGGTVVDRTGAVVANAKVTLTEQVPTGNSASGGSKREAVTDGSGKYLFAFVDPGSFLIDVAVPGFAPAQQSGILQSGEDYAAPDILLNVASADTAVDVTLSQEQIAEDEVKIEEKQRILGVVPNYYVTYDPHAPPLTTRLKFQLAWKSMVNPFSFGVTGAIAGLEQAADTYGGYGQGAAGYGRRYGAAYGDLVSGTLIGGAILPVLFKQDPRYFVKGTGTTGQRVRYAMANAVIRKGDNGRWQPDYSGILGGLAAGGISNLYYPPADRSGAGLTFENTAIGIAGGAATNLLQEFLLKKLTPHAGEKSAASN